MSELVEYKGFKINISQDEFGYNPRTDCSNGGKMICFHRNYDLGDKHDFTDSEELIEFVNNSDKVLAALPLFLYDHSGITMSTGTFSCRFDSGQVGIIFITQEGCDEMGYTEEWAKGDWNKGGTFKSALEEVLEMEVKEFDKYISEGSYLFDVDGVDDVSCGGFLGYDHEESGLLDHARAEIDAEISYKIKQRVKKVKEYIKAKVPVIYRVLPSL